MRALEILQLLLLSLFASSLALERPRRRRWRRLAVLMAASIWALHLLFEGARWQMAPAYLLLALLGASFAAGRAGGERLDRSPRRGWSRRAMHGTVPWVALPIALGFAWFLPAAVPVFELPDPTGDHAIGVVDLPVVFRDRPEILTADPNDLRELTVRAWYPALPGTGLRAVPYFTSEEARGVAAALGSVSPTPPFFYSHATLVETHSRRDAELQPPAAAGWPVLVFSHGYTSFAAQNTSLMEELASHGYVVFSLSHTYDGSAVLDGGRVVGLGEHAKRWTRSTNADPERALARIRTLVAADSDRERRRALDRFLEQTRAERAAGLGVGVSWDVWIEDRRRFFDVLEELQAGVRPSPFTGALDLDAIGVFGMSFGGATAAEVCHQEPRCRAAINIDGGHMYGVDSPLLEGDIAKPLLMIHASEVTTESAPHPGNPGDFVAYNDFHYETPGHRGSRSDVLRIRIAGTAHLHLSDMSLMVRWIPGMASALSGSRIARILNAYSRDFFDVHVRRSGSALGLLEGPVAAFPEVGFQTFGRPLGERAPLPLPGPTG